MKRKTGEQIMSAVKPNQIFSMNPDTIEQEKDEYLEQFKPQEYNTIKNFMVTQKVIQLYRQALSELGDRRTSTDADSYGHLELTGMNGEAFSADYQYQYNEGPSKTYVTEGNIVLVFEQKYKKYYQNYIDKAQSFPHMNEHVWETIKYSLPKVSKHFQDTSGKWIIILDKPTCKIYPLREILNYFDEKMQPEHVASILTRLYNFVCYMELVGLNHNGITVDNLFFAPGRTVAEGDSYSVEDMRIVGVYGGWCFTTRQSEKIQGMPRKIHDILAPDTIKNGYSSFEVDELAIKQVARELLGDITGENLEDVPLAFVHWVNDSCIRKNAYEEFTSWEKARTHSFGQHRFVEMDVPMD